MTKIKHSPSNVKQPNQAYTRQEIYDSRAHHHHHHPSASAWSPPTNNTVVENMSSAATLTSKDESSSSFEKKSNSISTTTSVWLLQRQKNNRRDRAMFGCIGLVVFVILLGTVVLWIGSAFILPQNKYSSTLAQVPRSSSYSFSHHQRPTSTPASSSSSLPSRIKPTHKTK